MQSNLTPLKQLESEEGRREYYTYDPSNPTSMRHHVDPYLDPRFNEELLDMFGTDVHGDPRLRISWAGTLRAKSYRQMEDGSTLEYEGMKYPYMRLRTIAGYEYFNDKGQKVTVATMAQVPKDALFVEVFEWDDLGTMKFVLEMKYTYEELVQIRRYPKPDTEEEVEWAHKNGKRIKEDPNPKGEYIFCHYIETHDGRYLEVSDDTIERIRDVFHTATTETEEEYVKRKLEARRQLAIAEQEQETLNYAHAVSNSRDRAERKLSKGKIIYG